jgi:uncharacterized phage infection (PIP) family protein YhgE
MTREELMKSLKDGLEVIDEFSSEASHMLDEYAAENKKLREQNKYLSDSLEKALDRISTLRNANREMSEALRIIANHRDTP